MKKWHIYLVLFCILLCSGCSKTKEEPLEIDLRCNISNQQYQCDNYLFEYNENHDLTLIKSVSDGTSYQYSYEDHKVTSISENNQLKYQISYNELKQLEFITALGEDKVEYHFSYDHQNRLKEISKKFNDEEVDETITYDYYYENEKTYIRETKNVVGYQTVSLFLSSDFARPQNAFELVNDFPSIYYEILKISPYSDFSHVNNSILYLPKIQESYTIRLNGEEANKISYYYDAQGRYITDSLETTVHSFEDKNDNEFTRITIYQKELGNSKHYYQYQTDYKLKDGEIIEFTKYKEKEISYDTFYNLKKNK